MTGQTHGRSLFWFASEVGELHFKALAYPVVMTHAAGGAGCGFMDSELQDLRTAVEKRQVVFLSSIFECFYIPTFVLWFKCGHLLKNCEDNFPPLAVNL